MTTSGQKTPPNRRLFIGLGALGGLGCCTLAVSGALFFALRSNASSLATGSTYAWEVVEPQIAGGIGNLNCPAPTVCYTSSNEAVLKTEDAGTSWTAYTPLVTEGRLVPGNIFCATELNCFASMQTMGYELALYATADGAQTWAVIPDSSDVYIHAADCSQPTICYALVGSSLSGEASRLAAIEFNGADATWRPVVELPPAVIVWDIACPTADTCIVVGEMSRNNPAQPPAILLVPLNGDAATSIALDPNLTTTGLTAIDCPTVTTCYAVGDYHNALFNNYTLVLKTTDGGQSWVQQSFDAGVDLNDVDCPTEQVCVTVGSRGNVAFDGGLNTKIVMTTDGGQTWQVVVDSTADEWKSKLAGILSDVECPSDAACIATGHQGTALKMTGGADK